MDRRGRGGGVPKGARARGRDEHAGERGLDGASRGADAFAAEEQRPIVRSVAARALWEMTLWEKGK